MPTGTYHRGDGPPAALVVVVPAVVVAVIVIAAATARAAREGEHGGRAARQQQGPAEERAPVQARLASYGVVSFTSRFVHAPHSVSGTTYPGDGRGPFSNDPARKTPAR